MMNKHKKTQLVRKQPTSERRDKYLHYRSPASTNSTTSRIRPRASPLSRTRTKTTSTYAPTTGHDPYTLQEATVDEKRALIAAELSDEAWTWEPFLDSKPHRPKFWDKFFPNRSDSPGAPCLNRLKRDGHYATLSNGRWAAIPTPEQLDREPSITREKLITEGFVPILNHVIATLNLSETRVGIDTQTFHIPTRDGLWLKPDVFLWGKGSDAFPYIEGKPNAKAGSSATRASTEAEGESTTSQIDWPWCCVPIEIKTSKARLGPTSKDRKHFVQLGTYVREVFAAQENRRFVPSLLLTELEVEFLLWDRGGVVVSERLDYHEDPLRFCNMLATLVTWDPTNLGFDPTVFYRDQKLHITSHGLEKKVEYVVQDTLFRSYTLVGRASTCWLARKVTDGTPGERMFVIVDSWVEGGVHQEHSLVGSIEDADADTGRACLISVENVKTMSWTGVVERDTVHHNRRHPRFNRANGKDLVHTRCVWQCEGSPAALENFRSSRELVRALNDVVQGVTDMFVKAGAMHRDIVPWNILIQRGAPKGSRGILIDFSRAALTDSSPRSDVTPGSHVFRSCAALQGNTAGSHLDDLESVYYLLCFIIGHHTGPGLASSRMPLPETPDALQVWTTTKESLASSVKTGHLFQNFQFNVPEYFSGPVERLARGMHNLLREKRMRGLRGTQLTKDEIHNDLREFQNLFLDATNALELSDRSAETGHKRTQTLPDARAPSPKKIRMNKGEVE